MKQTEAEKSLLRSIAAKRAVTKFLAKMTAAERKEVLDFLRDAKPEQFEEAKEDESAA